MALIFSLINYASANSKMNIFQIFDQFLLSSHAASSCIKPEEKTLTNHLANFKAVWDRTLNALTKKHSSKPKEYSLGLMNKRNKFLKIKINEIVKKNGCKDNRIKKFIKIFNIQAKMTLG